MTSVMTYPREWLCNGQEWRFCRLGCRQVADAEITSSMKDQPKSQGSNQLSTTLTLFDLNSRTPPVGRWKLETYNTPHRSTDLSTHNMKLLPSPAVLLPLLSLGPGILASASGSAITGGSLVKRQDIESGTTVATQTVETGTTDVVTTTAAADSQVSSTCFLRETPVWKADGRSGPCYAFVFTLPSRPPPRQTLPPPQPPNPQSHHPKLPLRPQLQPQAQKQDQNQPQPHLPLPPRPQSLSPERP